MRDMYLEFNNQQITLTDEQKKIILSMFPDKTNIKTAFNRLKIGDYYYSILNNHIVKKKEENTIENYIDYCTANYCVDEALLKERNKQEILNRLLWRFSLECDWDDKVWNDTSIDKWYIERSYLYDVHWKIQQTRHYKDPLTVYFLSKKVAQQALEEIVIPFEKEWLGVCNLLNESK